MTRIADPNGNVTTSELDSHGNLIRLSEPFSVGNDQPVTDFAYNSFGQCVSMMLPMDGQGRRRMDTFTYHANGPQRGYLASARRDDGGLNLLTSYEYDARGNVTRLVDPRDNDQLLTYNALDQLMRRQSAPNSFAVRSATDYFYDANDNLVQIDYENRDEAGALNGDNPAWTTASEFDLLNRETLRWHKTAHVVQQGPVGNTNRFFYDANGNVIRKELPEAVSGADPNNVMTWQYDERNLLFRDVPAPGTDLGATNEFDYDPNRSRKKVKKVDAITIKQTTYEYDGFDRRVRITDPMGNAQTSAFDANGNLLFRRLDGETNDVAGAQGNRRLTEMRYEYDALDRLVQQRVAFFGTHTGQPIGDGETTTSFSYAPNSLLLSETDDNGRTSHFSYDTAHRFASATDPGSNVVSFTYDANGNALTRVQTDRSDLGPAQVFTTTFEYDHLNRRIKATDNVGNNQNWGFNSQDNIVRHADPRGNDSVFEYDGLSRPLRTTHYSGQAAGGIIINTSHVEYHNDRLAASTDGNTITTFYAYDSLDRRTLIINPDGTTHTFVWDAFSNLFGGQDANGTVISNSFDLLDRCVRRDISPGQGVAGTTTFEEFSYDGASRLVSAANDSSIFLLVWEDSRSNVGQQSQTAGGVTLSSQASFDSVGNRLSLTHPSGRVVSSTFDALDRPTSVSMNLGGGPAAILSW